MGHAENFFYGSNANITFVNIIFANGNSSGSGGALHIENQSYINLFNCSFVNNSAETGGGAINAKYSALNIAGSRSSFINNTGILPALYAIGTQLNLYDTFFQGNTITKYVRSVLQDLRLRYMY
jgi:predicted outer membrane repeat protein